MVAAINTLSPDILVEVLTPDFQGRVDLVAQVAGSGIAVFGHNVEVPRRLTKLARDRRCSFDTSLSVLRVAKHMYPQVLTKSSLMLGLGETEDEIFATLGELRDAGVDMVTLGQYLQPGRLQMEVEKYYSPDEFAALEARARDMGFAFVAAGPHVRSSYRAGGIVRAGTPCAKTAGINLFLPGGGAGQGYRTGGTVHRKAVAVAHRVGDAGDSHHRGNAEFPGHDGPVGQLAADLGDHRRRQGNNAGPAGIEGVNHQHVAGAEREKILVGMYQPDGAASGSGAGGQPLQYVAVIGGLLQGVVILAVEHVFRQTAAPVGHKPRPAFAGGFQQVAAGFLVVDEQLFMP